MRFFVFLFFSFLFSLPPQLADGVLAVVGNQVVLFSDVKDETDLIAKERALPFGSALYENIFRTILEKNINNKVILNFAKQDSLLEVPYEEIKRVLDERVSFYVQRFGSAEEFERVVGMSVLDMKEKHWRTIEDELLIEKYKLKNFKNVFITKHDVLAFYEEYKDSLPPSPPVGSFSLFQKKIEVSKKTINSFVSVASLLRDSLSLGLLDFSSIALSRSIDPSAKTNKGVLVSLRGELVPEYEKAAYLLELNEVSPLVKSDFGYHIIKLLDKKGEKITTQHILLSLPLGEDDVSLAFSFVDSIKQKTFNDPGLFDSLSISLGSGFSGLHEGVFLEDYPPFVRSFIESGENFSFSDVVREGGFFNLIYKYSFVPSQSKTLETDWFELETLTINKKRFDDFNLWISNKKDKLYILIKDF